MPYYPVTWPYQRIVTVPFQKGIGQSYTDDIIGIDSDNLIALWPLTEISGLTAFNAEGTVGRNGTYSGPTLNAITAPDGSPAPRFDGVNDFVDIDTSSLNSAFDGQLFTVAALCRMFDSSTWSDGVRRYILRLQADPGNDTYLAKDNSTDVFRFRYEAGSTAKSIEKSSISPTDWFWVGMTVDLIADEFIAYLKLPGTSLETVGTLGSLGTWAGTLNSLYQTIGAGADDGTGTTNGYISHVALWNAALTSTQLEPMWSIIA